MQQPARRSFPARFAVVIITAVAAAVVALTLLVRAGADRSVTSGAPSAAAIGSDAPKPSNVAIDEAICRLEQPPAPPARPAPANGDHVDTADAGPGRWRICLSAPVAVEVEGPATCTWSDDRTTVRDISGVPLDDGSGMTIDGGIALLEKPSVVLSVSPNQVDVQSFDTSRGDLLLDSADAGRRGAAAVRLGLFVNSDQPPAIPAPDRVGTIRWACGAAPPNRPGRSTGQVTLRLDEPIGKVWQVPAMCNWTTTPAGARLTGVETHAPAIEYDGALVAILVGPNPGHPERVDLSLWVDRTTAGDFYRPAASQIVVRQARDGSTGLVRIRHLTIDETAEVRIADGVTDVSGIVSWTCPPPPVAGPVGDPFAGGEEPELRAGTATILLDPAVAAPAEGAITCTIDRSNAPTLQVRQLRGSIPAGGGRYDLLFDGGSVVLALIGPDGQPAGEYTGQVLRISDDPTLPSLELAVSPIVFEPTDPRYVPLGGPDGPRELRLQIDYSCPL
jgi:hypothetical protein